MAAKKKPTRATKAKAPVAPPLPARNLAVPTSAMPTMPSLPTTRDDALVFIAKIVEQNTKHGRCDISSRLIDIPGVAKALTQLGYTFGPNGPDSYELIFKK